MIGIPTMKFGIIFLRYFLVLLLANLSNCAWDEDAIPTTWQIAEDPTSQLSFRELSSLNWKPTNLPKVLGFSNSRIWLHTKIAKEKINASSTSNVYYLINPVSFVEKIQIYEVSFSKKENALNFNNIDEAEILNQQLAGSTISNERKFYKKFPFPIFQFESRSDKDLELLMSFKSESSMYIEPLLFDEESMENAAVGLQLHLSVFFTILIIILLFNLSQYFHTRNSTYFYYSLHIIAVMLYQIAYTGMGKIYIWNGELEWNRRSLVVLGSLSFLALIQFSKRFLSLQIRSVILFNIANVFLVSLFLNSILGFIIPIHISDPLTHIISFLTCIYLLIACIKIFNSGINIVKFYLVGLVTLILSILFFNLFALGILQYTILRHSIEVGTLVELFIFNIAIWAKIHALNLNQESMATTAIKNTKNLINNDLIEEDLFNQSPPEESRTREFHNDNSPRQTNKISSRIEKINIPTILKNLDQLMNENIFYDEDLTLARLASFLEIRPDQLSEILNKKMNMNFNQYINEIRIKEVQKELDRSSPRNLLDLAFSVGFNSKSAFNKAFREIVGVTPRDYRKESNKILH